MALVGKAAKLLWVHPKFAGHLYFGMGQLEATRLAEFVDQCLRSDEIDMAEPKSSADVLKSRPLVDLVNI